jgi:hypothetical protein
VQSAIFSECVYSQTLADKLQLNRFFDVRESNVDGLTVESIALLKESSLVPRYVYQNSDESISLVQAGGHAGIDAVLIVEDLGLKILIEFKEPKAKTSEPDLPKYLEDGYLYLSEEWEDAYPQFVPMAQEQIAQGLNFFEVAGTNVNDFSAMSIQRAVAENYAGSKFADVVVTEDRNAFLTLLPANQLATWADLKGEIRPAGRNHYSVWTPAALERIISSKSGAIAGDEVSLPVNALSTTAPRGGTGVSRYKIHPFFFVRSGDVALSMSDAQFRLDRVRQLNPTISAHMYFTSLDVNAVKDLYLGGY